MPGGMPLVSQTPWACKNKVMKFKTVKHFDFPGQIHELTFSCFGNQQFFKDESLCQWFTQDLDNCRNRGLLKLLAYVIMPCHVHLLIIPENGIKMNKILGSVKIPLTRRILFNRFNYHDLLLMGDQKVSCHEKPIPGTGPQSI